MTLDMATTKANHFAVQQLPRKGMREEHAEEFAIDFSDVFGPAPPHPKLMSDLRIVDDEDGENGATNGWNSESQSAVGPQPALLKEFCEFAIKASAAGFKLGDSEDDGLKKLGPDDFELLRVVGQGSFGRVFQVRKKGSSEIYAMKVMGKHDILERNLGSFVKAEREILSKLVHPFIVRLRYSFQTKSKLYLVMDFINGGHLSYQLYREGIFDEDVARMYVAEIVLALAHIHKNGIMHRDLKPENILLDAEGHIRLTDFGLAKEVGDDLRPSKSFCGTLEYMAPEIMQYKGHGKAADWWSVGVLLYEMLVGQPPFLEKNRRKLQEKIIKGKIYFPTYLTGHATNILKGLLQKNPDQRLGNGPTGSDDIKQHKWFRSMNWRKIEMRQVTPKFLPMVSGKHCTANFDEKLTKLRPEDIPSMTPKSSNLSFFQNYTYVAPKM